MMAKECKQGRTSCFVDPELGKRIDTKAAQLADENAEVRSG
jgi:hypothetical protein